MTAGASAPLVFITGASSGIGQALAMRYRLEGWRVALIARSGERLEDFARASGWDGDVCRVYPADVRNVDSITAAGVDCLARQGVPDVVIANAGVSVGIDSARRDDLEVMRTVVETNLLGLAATFQPFMAPMVARGHGRLVGVASVAGIRGLPGHGAYCSSKAGAISYCESLRGELRASGVRVVTIVPGYVDTPLTQRNRYPMPFLMSADAFAARAFACIAAGRSYCVIPWPMAVVAWLLRALPNPVFDRLLVGRPRKARVGE
jgi:short-subunit dehydrogenase